MQVTKVDGLRVWVVVSRNYQNGVLPQAKKDRLLEVFPDQESAYAYSREVACVFDYVVVSSCLARNFLEEHC